MTPHVSTRGVVWRNGAGVGAWGGLAGRNQFERANPAHVYQSSFYGAPAGGYAPPPFAAPGGQAPQASDFPPPAPPQQG